MSVAEKNFNELTERFFDWYWKNHPEEATSIGDHRYDQHLSDFSEEGILKRTQAVQGFLKELKNIPGDKLPLETRVDYKLLHSMLKKKEREQNELKHYQTKPESYTASGLGGVYLLVIRNFAPLEERMESIRARLKEFPRVLAEGRQRLENPPRVFVETELLSLPGTIGFFSHVLPNLAEKTPALKAEIDQGCRQVVDALDQFREFLESIRDDSSGDYAVGENVFERMLTEDHFLDYNCETLLEKGKELVEETQKEMEKITEQIDPDKRWEEIINDTKKEHPSEEELLDYYRQESEKAKEFVRQKNLVDLHAGELVIEETPEPFRPIIPYAAYLNPAPLEEEQTGRFFVTPVDPDKDPAEKEAQLGEHSYYSVPLTVLHEGYPGHHLQLCYANRASSLLKKIAHSTLFIEGWAFYCEQLMEQQGYLKDPRNRLHRLKDQLWRACRIVADVSLHTGKMAFDEAVDYMEKVALLERNSAVTEVRRYTATPTQPMSYLIGKLEILKIVEEYRKKKGNDFNLKEFHHALLKYGSLPPELIRELLFSCPKKP